MSWKNTLNLFARNFSLRSKLGNDPNLCSLTQFPDVTKEFQNKQIVIGLDFGTAFTKVVLGDDKIRYAVPLRGKPLGIDAYLLPCVYWVDENGHCSLASGKGRQVSDIKMRMLNGDLGPKLQEELCAFLALVLKKSRAYFFSEYEQIYKKNYIRWLVNIGLPTSSYHDKNLVTFYQKMVQAAWFVSLQKAPVTLDFCSGTISGKVSSELKPEGLDHDVISPFPEFVAQITGYVRSPLRNNDLHFLVDVGAGTVDATVFNVHQVDGEDRFPIFAKAVKPLGTQYLIKNRLKGLNRTFVEGIDQFSDVPKIKDFAKITNQDIYKIRQIDKDFKSSLVSGLKIILEYTKNNRYPLSRTWDNGIPFFLCGGGSNCDFYIESIVNENNLNQYKLRSKNLPKPENLKADKVTDNQYNRLSVAYGLSFDPFDIGEIIQMEAIEDILPEKTQPSAYQSKIVNCTKCQGTGGLHGYCDHCGGSGYLSFI